MTINSLLHVSDRALTDAIVRAAADTRRSVVELLTLLGEFDTRRLYLAEGFPSLFVYCDQALGFSEHEAYHRIEAARAVRSYPILIDRLRDGSLTLTSATLLRPHLTPENADALIAAALHKSRREVEHQMAALAPKAEVRSIVRRLPSAKGTADSSSIAVEAMTAVPASAEAVSPAQPSSVPQIPLLSPRSISAPLSSDRYLLRVTLTTEGQLALQRARDLLRHSVTDGDPSAIVERALTLLVDDLERRRIARVGRPRQTTRVESHSRHVPAAVRREVWSRDQGRCAFVGRRRRCPETGGLEFHHVHPYALGGPTNIDNIELRCRAHNQYEGALLFGPGTTEGPGSRRLGPGRVGVSAKCKRRDLS